MNPEEVERTIELAMENLSIEERGIIELRYKLGGELYAYSYDDLAKIFKKPRGEIIQIKNRAVKNMKPILEALVSLN